MKIQALFDQLVNFDLNYGRRHILDWCNAYLQNPLPGTIRILDIGCGSCTDLKNIQNIPSCQAKLFGIEVSEQNVLSCEHAGITIFPIDIERAGIPVEDKFLDLVIANQVLEHTKEIFFIFSEISRVLKPGGLVIIGVPNLAAYHNRLLLLLGRQPTNIEVLGPHVRGFTIRSLKRFIETDGFFEVIDIRGSHLYGFPIPLSGYLGRLFPGASASIFLLARRTGREGRFIEVLKTRPFETNYFQGALPR